MNVLSDRHDLGWIGSTQERANIIDGALNGFRPCRVAEPPKEIEALGEITRKFEPELAELTAFDMNTGTIVLKNNVIEEAFFEGLSAKYNATIAERFSVMLHSNTFTAEGSGTSTVSEAEGAASALGGGAKE